MNKKKENNIVSSTKTKVVQGVATKTKLLLGVVILFAVVGVFAFAGMVFKSFEGDSVYKIAESSVEAMAKNIASRKVVKKEVDGIIVSTNISSEVCGCENKGECKCENGDIVNSYTIELNKYDFPEDITLADGEKIVKKEIDILVDILNNSLVRNSFSNYKYLGDYDAMIDKINSKVFSDWILGKITDEEAKKLDWCLGVSGCTPVGIGNCNWCVGGNGNWNWGCFLRGTKISLSNGNYVAIENVKVGDIVKSYNIEDNEFSSSRVNKIFNSKTNGYYIINDRELMVTQSHKIFINNNKWVYVKDIKVGDIMFKEDGTEVIVKNIEYIENSEDIFNFEVEDFSNYFANGYLVHNKDFIGGYVSSFKLEFKIHF